MSPIWQDLAGNLAVVIVFISAWTHAQHWLDQRTHVQRVWLFGLWTGLGAVSSMLLAVQLQPGIFFDLRACLVMVAGLLKGPLAGVIAAVVAGGYRLAVGGAGAPAGMVVIVTALAAGTLAHVLRPRLGQWPAFALGAVGAGIAGCAGMFFLPQPASTIALSTYALPVGCLNAAAGMLAAVTITRAITLRAERHLLRSALTQAPDYLYVKDLESRFVAVNQAVAEHNGYLAPKDMIGKSDYDIASLDRARALFDNEQQVIRGGKPIVDLEEVVKDGNGRQRSFLTSKVPIRDAHGQAVGLVGVTRDVTQFRELEKELRESRNLFSRALSEMSDGVAMFDSDGKLVFCNERYWATFPLTQGARHPGATLRSILQAVVETGEQVGVRDNPDQFITDDMATLKTGGEQQVELYNGRWLHVRTRPGTDGSALVVVSDATTMKQAEGALRGLNEQLRAMATTDALTGLANRRAFDEALPEELKRAKRQSQSLALLMVDVDKFKSYNDAYGHPAGDACLREVGKTLARVVRRPGDLAARYGGEEFAVLLPDTDEDGAFFVAEAFRNTLKSLALPHKGSAKGFVTASVGISVSRVGDVEGDLVRKADEALYDAKDAGRDRVVGWSADRHQTDWNAVVDGDAERA